MQGTERPSAIALGNTLRIVFEAAKVADVLTDGLALRGFLAATRAGGPIHATLAAAAVAVGDGSGDYVAEIPGTAITAQLTAYLHTSVWIVGESVPVGSYRGAFAVRVVQDQGAS